MTRPIWIKGNWCAGWVLDLHTKSSHPSPGGGFDTKRTELGELLYRLKYDGDRRALEPLAKTAAKFISERHIYRSLKAIIPIPPSVTNRSFQPVAVLAASIGKLTKLEAPENYLTRKTNAPELKNINNPALRRKALKNSFQVSDCRYEKECVMLFDDLYRSGETLYEATRTLYNMGKAERVYVFAMTRTRVKK